VACLVSFLVVCCPTTRTNRDFLINTRTDWGGVLVVDWGLEED
jgi:hypothetical protein